MESLPSEFLSHHLPLMFFAGLDPPLPDPGTEGEASNQPYTTSQDKFTALIETLRTVVLSSKSSHPSIWYTCKTYPTTFEFRVLLVPKAIKFPPRKTRPSSVSTTSTNAVSHSPLSPLSQTSPLFPNGIMTPIWIRKHRDMIPSVFVLTLRLWEAPQQLGIRPMDQNQDRSEHEKYDDELIHEIIDRKKTTSERGIKLTVIILTSRYMLDNPQLDARLSYIRKRSSLDARASLFVLSPVPPEDVVSFVNTLKAELYESSIDYYREHSRRVRRKRSRSSSNAFSQSAIYHQPGQPVITPLGPQGWNVRSDYKLATYAEFRQEFDVAVKSYEDSWEGLIQMFNSTAVLPPRTKRWAEAKIFIDCINFKISKLYLYSNEPTRAMYQFNRHIHKFRELFNGWGIGDETFELWSWLSKQYTVLADLIDIGCRNGMRLPNLCPPLIAAIDKNRSNDSPVLPESRLAGGGAINLTGVLVHPGFYYFYAAQCAVERQDRFRASNAAEEEMRSVSESIGDSTQFQPSLALAHERKVNHAEMIISLYTRSYEIFKTVGSNRMTLFLALKIALVHHRQSDHKTSQKFFERILASYRKGPSSTLLNDILYLSYENLSGLVGNLQTISIPESGGVAPEAIQLLKISLELLGRDPMTSDNTASQRSVINTLTGLIQPLAETAAFSGETITLDMQPMTFPVRCQVAFWESSINLGDEVEFQVLFRIPQAFSECKPPITQISLKFTSTPMITISHQDSQLTCSTQILNLDTVPQGSKQHTLNLQVREKSYWLINGRLKPSVADKIVLEKVIFRLEKVLNGATADFAIIPDPPEDPITSPLKWFDKFDTERNELVLVRTESLQSFCQVQHRKPKVTFTLDYQSCGIIGQRQSLQLQFHNQENDSVNLRLKIKLQSPSSHDSIEFDNQTYQSPEDLTIHVGNLKADQDLQKSLYFIPTGAVGLRDFEISLAIKTHASDFNVNDCNKDGVDSEVDKVKDEGDDDDDDNEKLEVLRIFKLSKKASVYIEELVQIKFNVQNFHQLLYPLNCNIFNPTNPVNRLNFKFIISNSSHRNEDRSSSLSLPIQVRNILLSVEKASCPTRILYCSLKADDSSDSSIDLNTGNSFAVSYVVEVELDPTQEEITNCFFQVSWAIPSSDEISTNHLKQVPLKIAMPILTPITVLTNLKSHLRIFEPVKIDYLIENRNLVKTVDVVVKILEKNTNEDHENDWILTGPKFINSMLILPRTFKSISFIGIPNKLGQISGPKVEIFQRITDHRNSHLLSRLPTTIESVSSLTELGGLQELGSDFEDNKEDQDHMADSKLGGNPLVGSDRSNHQSSPSFVQVPIFRSRSSVFPYSLNEELDSNNPYLTHTLGSHDLKVLVLPSA